MITPQYRQGRRSLLALAVVLVTMVVPRTSAAAEYLTAAAGGGGGNSFSPRCPDDHVLAGISGLAGGFIDRVQLLCVQVDPLGRWVGNEKAYAALVAGGTGGSAFKLLCPRDHAVSGIAGKAASLIDQLRIRCGPLTGGPRLATVGSMLTGQAGGTGGNSFGSWDCADGKPGRGLTGRASSYVDQLRLACDYPPRPLRPVDAYIRLSGSTVRHSIIRKSGWVEVLVDLSGTARGDIRIPAASSHPEVAPFTEVVGGAASGNVVLKTSLTRSVGCTTFTLGFPGDSVRPLTVLVDQQDTALNLTPSILEWGATTTSAYGTLSIPTAAPAGGLSIALTSSHPTIAAVPASVTISSGTRSTTFEIRRTSTMGACVTLTARGNGVTAQSPIQFRPVLRTTR
ncbi:MAG: hypothetical protein EPO25_06660 [Gammaproteobacteria bacterium]|nr:MAG: hypothetical protein EPO25_06660 [Gammaproteobacteria bacterium]